MQRNYTENRLPRLSEATRNSLDVLHRLRTNTEARLLWIDAICIDQGSVPEINHQIQLMRCTYEKADRVSTFVNSSYGRV